jgi:hypothetical protein
MNMLSAGSRAVTCGPTQVIADFVQGFLDRGDTTERRGD